MATAYTCPRCGRWHTAGTSCDPSTALDAYRKGFSEVQHTADAAETHALIRYRLARSR